MTVSVTETSTSTETFAPPNSVRQEQHVTDVPWVTIVWNDPVNLQSYVAYVFRTYFGFSRSEADRRMLCVHNEGKAVVASGAREQMERHVEAMHDFGLWATLTKSDS